MRVWKIVVSLACQENLREGRTFWTWELTRLTVLSHVQEKVLALGRLKGDDSWSAGSSYTGITTTPNLQSSVNYLLLRLG